MKGLDTTAQSNATKSKDETKPFWPIAASVKSGGGEKTHRTCDYNVLKSNINSICMKLA